jgi:hypothetical protein
MQKIGLSLFAGALLFSAVGCDDGVADTAGNAGRCQRICNAVEECAGDSFDVGDCRRECTDNSEDDGFEEQAQECSECLERDNECSENIAECGSVCAAVATFSAVD